jgi:hypothetical protein
MTVWDQFDRFTAEDASNLAHPQNPLEAKALLTMMQKAYGSALRETSLKHFETAHLDAITSTNIKIKYHSLECALPEAYLYSYSLRLQADLLFRPDPSAATCKFFHDWCNDETGDDGVFSSSFKAQEFTRDELHRWLTCHELESSYSFERATSPEVPAAAPAQLDASTLANPSELLKAFGQWGLRQEWFDSPRSHGWLWAARKQVGVGGNSPKPPLYCPYEVMLGLAGRIRRGADAPPRMSKNKGWSVLERHFPEAYEKFKHLNCDDDQRY